MPVESCRYGAELTTPVSRTASVLSRLATAMPTQTPLAMLARGAPTYPAAAYL